MIEEKTNLKKVKKTDKYWGYKFSLSDFSKDGFIKVVDRLIKEAVFGMDRVFNVLYYVYSDIKAKGESNRGSFKYIYMN